MQAHPDPGLVYGCMTHGPMWVEYPPFVQTIHLGQAQCDGRLNLRDLAPEWEPYHPVLGGTAGSFALKNYVRRYRPDATRVGLCQYRKFVSRSRLGGVPAPSYPVMDVVKPSQVTPPLLARAVDPGDAELLVTKPILFGKPKRALDMLAQYQSAHPIEDFLRFTAEAVDVGALSRDEVSAFLHETLFVPGGVELGVYPAAFWLQSIEAVEATVRACVQKLPARRDGYQTRAWSFCAERLGSYLLLKAFRPPPTKRLFSSQTDKSPFPEKYVGQLNLISDTETIDYTNGSSPS